MTARQGQRASYDVIDEVALWAEVSDRYRSHITRRRSSLIAEAQQRYGITLHAHPRMPHAVVVSATDYDTLRAQVQRDRRLDAVGRGYYWYLGGELNVITAPDWACDPATVARLRFEVVAIYRPIRRFMRRLLRVAR